MRLLRNRLGLTQEEVGRKLGCSTTQVSNYETDKHEMPYGKMLKFCDYFQVTTNWIMGQKPMNHLTLRGAQ
jgi:transcriptional regulator with XRE-family HTH domain